ncbi:FecR family protein [Marinospirillum perlucidum]|uniref:FecR family protein n=1 Tax=Marinospirillum perlucidum TaxID=1982602 RepID=UPI000DF2D8B5|nr:FecR family protein [Marinospirillum perlucidum]
MNKKARLALTSLLLASLAWMPPALAENGSLSFDRDTGSSFSQRLQFDQAESEEEESETVENSPAQAAETNREANREANRSSRSAPQEARNSQAAAQAENASSAASSDTGEARCEVFARLERTEGQVRVSRAGQPFPQRVSSLPHDLCPGDKVQTVSGARAHIGHPGGQVVMSENSLLVVNSIDEVELEEGAALFDIARREEGRFTARTPLVVIGVKGTRFLVASNDERNDVALFSGEVNVGRQDGAEMAYYQAKSVDEMTFAEYQEYQRREFREFRDSFNQEFQDYKDQVMAEFSTFCEDVDMQPGRQLTLGEADGQPEAVGAPVDKGFEALKDDLSDWL